MKKKLKTLEITSAHLNNGMSGYLQAMGMINDDEEVVDVGRLYQDGQDLKYKIIVEKVDA